MYLKITRSLTTPWNRPSMGVARSGNCILVVSYFSRFRHWVRFSGVFIQRFVCRWWLEMLYQSFFPVFPHGKVIVVQEGSVTNRLWKFTTINAINPHHDHRRVTHLCTSVQCHFQFTAAKLARKIIAWHNSQHFPTGVHAFRHIVYHRLANLKVSVVYTVVKFVFFHQRYQLFLNPV